MKDNDQNVIQTKIAKYALIVSIITLIISTGISMFTLYQTNETSKQLLDYQLEQERLPNVTALNYDLPIGIVTIDAGIGENPIDFSHISSNLYPIKIPLYNVGVGFAQNCSVTWDQKSIDDACANMSALLSRKLNVHEYDISEISSESGTIWAFQDLIFQKEHNKYVTVRYDKYFSFLDEEQEYTHEATTVPIMCQDINVPFILPVLTQDTPVYVEMSEGLSILLLEIANQEITSPISFRFDISYQDLAGKNYSNSIDITFLLKAQENNAPPFFEVTCKKQ